MTPEEIKQKNAREALKRDLGEEKFKVLMEGVDAIVDVTNKFGMPYKKAVEKMRESSEKGLVVEKNGMIYGLEKKDEDKEKE